MSAEPWRVPCEGSGCPPARKGWPLCSMCGHVVDVVGGTVGQHDRNDIIAMLDAGAFDGR